MRRKNLTMRWKKHRNRFRGKGSNKSMGQNDLLRRRSRNCRRSASFPPHSPRNLSSRKWSFPTNGEPPLYPPEELELPEDELLLEELELLDELVECWARR
jgi:hypothetical protein